MVFYTSQLGRFAAFRRLIAAAHGPDHAAAHLLAADGDLAATRPGLDLVLAEKGFLRRDDSAWLTYANAFRELISRVSRLSLLAPACPPRSGQSSAMCVHELAAPLQHWTLRAFPAHERNTVVVSGGGLQVDQSATPFINYVIDEAGEILVGVEDHDWIKHSSLGAGLPVWAAGQLGLEDGKLRLINLRSGHYVGMNVVTGSTEMLTLSQFARDVFELYCDCMGLHVLASDFRCV